MFTTSEEVIRLIEQKKRNGIALKRFKQYMKDQGNPHLALKCIHIAGTNGKGSTTNTLRSILQSAGYQVGSFTSPYLETHHDRIRINDVFIEEASFVAIANEFYDSWVAYDLSMFEIDMFIAVHYFLNNKVDYCIFEVGLGGQEDATNIVTPLLSIITNIGMDHSEYLGSTYESIAKQKGGIIKPNIPLITNEHKEECLEVFRKLCKQNNSEMICCQKSDNVYVDDELHFTYRGYDVVQPTLATYQAKNTACAIEAIDYLNRIHELQVSTKQMLDGIAVASWKGRFEVIQTFPTIILDGAHNLEGIEALVESAKNHQPMNVLFSALRDKPYKEMIEKLLTISDHITICEFQHDRSAKAEEIANDLPVKIEEDYKMAIEKLIDMDTTLLVCGSLYFISEVRKYLIKKGDTTRI